MTDAAAGIPLRCPACGPVQVRPAAALLHENRRDGFRLLQAVCPTCGEVVVTADPERLAQARAGGVPTQELLPHLPALCEADLAILCDELADDVQLARFLRGDPPLDDVSDR